MYVVFFFFKQKTAYEMLISDWSSDVCSSDLLAHAGRKASTWSPLTRERGTVPVERGGWQTVAPSAVAYEGFAEPVALDEAGIEAVVADFAAAAGRAWDAGFSVIEVHAAHGYLLQIGRAHV